MPVISMDAVIQWLSLVALCHFKCFEVEISQTSVHRLVNMGYSIAVNISAKEIQGHRIRFCCLNNFNFSNVRKYTILQREKCFHVL